MNIAWSVRIDGAPGSLSEAARLRLNELALRARERLGGAGLVRFVDVRRLRNWSVVTAGIGPGEGVVRAQRCGPTIEDALVACCDSISSRLTFAADHAGSLSQRAPVFESLLRTWIVPADCPGFTVAEIEQSRDEQFVYHLSDEEALIRAKLCGDPFYFYGARGHCVTNVLLELNGRWYRLEDVERPAWQLPMDDGPPVSVSLVPAEGPGDALAVGISREHLVHAPTLAAATSELERRSPPILSVVIDDWGLHGFLVQESSGWVRAFGYESDVFAIGAQTGPFGVPTWVRPPSKPEPKWARLKKILACPRCRSRLDEAAWENSACRRCGRPFLATPDAISFVDHPSASVVHDPEAARNPPSKQLVHDLRLNPDGLILNVGAGDAALKAENLVNLEISRYATTDVVADAQLLPFADGSFDMVFSQSVLEHVPDPFACAREMQRVLADRGTLYADAPFIAPFHGYPDHYFNISMNGMRRLFAELQEIDVREGPHHAPSLAVSAVLSRFCALIRDEGARRAVLGLSVRELLDLLRTGRNPAITRDLDPAKTFEISAGFAFYGMKRGP